MFNFVFYSLLVIFSFLPDCYGEEKAAFALKAEKNQPDPQQVLAAQLSTDETKEWVQEKTGDMLPLDTVFKNEQGEDISLREIIDRPTLLLPVYFYCPRSCSFDLANLAFAVANTKHPAETFKVIALSFNDAENHEVAARSKPNFMQLLENDYPPEQWSFLTGTSESITKITEAIGYRFKKQQGNLFIHPSALVALAEDGKIIKYVYGSFISGDVDLAIKEAEQGTPANSIRRFLSFCYNYSPKQNQKVFTILKQATVALLAGGFFYFIFFVLRRSK